MRTGQRSAPPPARRAAAGRRRGLVPPAVLLGAVGCAVLAVALVARRGEGGAGPRPIAIATVTTPGRPALLSLAGTRLWTGEVGARRLRAFDAASAAADGRARRLGGVRELVTALAPAGGGGVAVALAADDGGRGRVLRVAPSGAVRTLARLEVAPRRIAVRRGAVVALGATRVELVPRAGTRWSRAVPGAVDVADGGGSVWTVARAGGGSVVARWSPAGRPLGRRAVPGAATAIAVGGDGVWVAGGCAGGVVRAPVGPGRATCIRTGGGIADVAVGDRAVWALDADGRRLLRLAPATGGVDGAARLPGRPLALAVGPGTAAVLLAGGRVVRVAAG